MRNFLTVLRRFWHSVSTRKIYCRLQGYSEFGRYSLHSSIFFQYPIEVAWKQQAYLESIMPKNGLKDPYKKLNCCLKCEQCQSAGSTAVVVGDCFFVNDYTKGRTMYESFFILCFCTLVQHASHKAEVQYKNNHNIVMVLILYYNKTIKHVKTLPDGTTYLVSVCFNIILGGVSHFAILYYNIQHRTVSVFDVLLNYKLTNWQKHAIHTIKTYRFEPGDSKVQTKY
jgi:hypothetical protein